MPADTPPESFETWAPPDHGSATWAPDAVAGARPSTPSDPEPAEPKRYADGGLLGRGGIAEVRSVHDAKLGRDVAVKRLRRLDSRIGRKRFHREARITAQLEHPGIVPIYDADVDGNGIPFYTMKYVRGTALSVALREAGDLSARLQLLPAFGSVCQAMAYAHDRRVIHRDLKPDNIMLGEFGEALVVDWGLARALDEDDEITTEVATGSPVDSSSSARPLHIDGAAITVQGQVAGTPMYMAPEQARGERTSTATDVFALGAILYELLTGQPPHGVAADVQEQLQRAVHDPIVPVLARTPGAPADLAAIAERALAPDPQDRYPTAAGLASEVQRWSTGRLVQAHAYTPWEHLKRFVERYRLPLAAGGLGLVGIAVVGAIGLQNTWVERDRAQASERKARMAADRAELALSRMLTERAERAVEDGDHAAARAFAAASLAIQEHPRARGALAKAWGGPGVRAGGSTSLPHRCQALAFVPETREQEIVCAGAGQVSRLTVDGDLAWTSTIDAEPSHLVVTAQDAWVGTDAGVVWLDPTSGDERGRIGAGVVRAMRDLNPGVRWYEETPRGLFAWRPGGPVERELIGGSRIVDLELRGGKEVRLHAAGYLTEEGGEASSQSVPHVAYDMAPLSDGWFVGGSSASWLHDSGEVTPLPALTTSLGRLQSNSMDQVVGISSDHTVWVYDTAAGMPVARIPSQEANRPAIALKDTALLTAHGRRLRTWTLPPPELRAPTFHWKRMEERPDGLARLFCGDEGYAELHDLVAHRVVPLPNSGVHGRLLDCAFRGQDPVANWSSAAVRWDPRGTRRQAEPSLPGVIRSRSFGSVLVDEADHAIATRAGQPLGHGLVPFGAPDELVVQDVDANVVRWYGPGPDPGRLEVIHELPVPGDRRALAVLPDRSLVHAPMIQSGDLVLDDEAGTRMQLVHPTRVTAAAPIGERWLITGDQRGTLYLWDLDRQAMVAETHAHRSRVHRIAITGERATQRVVSASFDSSLHTWSVHALFMDASEAVSAAHARDGLVIDEGEIGLPSHDADAP